MDYEQIENYLEGKLEGEQLQQFEHRLQTDPSFAETVRLYRNIEHEMKTDANEQLLKEQIGQLNKKHFGATSSAKTISINKRWYLIAAAAAVVGAIILLIPVFTGSSKNAERLFAELTPKDSLSVAVRGRDAPLKEAIAQVYNNQQYFAALPLLEQCTRDHPDEVVYSFAKAVCYTETGNYPAAIRDLDTLRNGNSIYKYRSAALKAFILFRQKQTNEAVELLKSIPPDAPEYEKAQQLIGKLQ